MAFFTTTEIRLSATAPNPLIPNVYRPTPIY